MEQEVVARTLRRVLLVQLDGHHLPALHRIASDPEVGRYWETRGEVLAVEELGALLFERQGFQVAITSRDGRTIGCCSLSDVAPFDGHGTVSLFVDAPYWGLGYAAEALVGYIDLVLASTPLGKLYFPMHQAIYERNNGVRRYLTIEGRLEGHVRTGETLHDMVIASITRERFRALADSSTLVRRVLAGSV